MQEPIRILREEHDNILRGLELLEACSDKLRDGCEVSPKTMEDLIEFFRLYADKTHHGKEEDLLFPAMIEHGFSREEGPIHCMLADHEHNRSLTREMIAATESYRGGDKKAGLRFAKAACEYVRALREHIQKENLVLFVMADNTLPVEDEPELLARFQEVDGKKIGAAEIGRLLRILEKVGGEVGMVEKLV
ncbi:MAG TPA: hemerythrin domain-containing protein [Terriglobales bacterium]|nr:hemerythrin domain-containing protein [Terriglobales bacterium]